MIRQHFGSIYYLNHVTAPWRPLKIIWIFKANYQLLPEGKTNRKKRWEDNVPVVPEWTGLGLGEALRNAEDREEWRKVVVRSSLMRQRSFRLRDEERFCQAPSLMAAPRRSCSSFVGEVK